MTSTKLFRAHAGLLASLDLEIEQASDLGRVGRSNQLQRRKYLHEYFVEDL